MEIKLPPRLQDYVDAQVANGAYQTPEELLEESLEMHRQHKLEALRREIMIGVEQADRGETVELTPELIEEIWKEGLADLESEGIPS